MFLCQSNVKITPKVGDFYLFPHYMMHNVYPFKGHGERRSMSFNVSIDEDIFEKNNENEKKSENEDEN